MIYYSIRVVEADTLDEATQKVMDNDFNEEHPLCDQILANTTLQAMLEVYESTDMND